MSEEPAQPGPGGSVELDPEFEVWTADEIGFEGLTEYRFLHHPLFSGDSRPLLPGGEAGANEFLQRRREELHRLEEAGDFEAAVRMHHHDHWAAALLEYKARLAPEVYWRLAGEFFCDHRWPSSGFESDWMEVFASAVPDREQMMTEQERAAFEALPSPVKVMRGFAWDSGARAFSWTRSRVVAERFAREAAGYRDAGPPRIAYGSVRKEVVIAVLLRRSEDELIVRPDDVTLVGIEELADPEAPMPSESSMA
jgi:hypothetical protein